MVGWLLLESCVRAMSELCPSCVFEMLNSRRLCAAVWMVVRAVTRDALAAAVNGYDWGWWVSAARAVLRWATLVIQTLPRHARENFDINTLASYRY